MKSTSIAVIGIFALLVILVLLLPQATKQQMQGVLFQWISPILRTGASVGHELGDVRGEARRLRLSRACCKPDQIIYDDVNRAANGVGL